MFPAVALLVTCLGCAGAPTHEYSPGFDAWPLCRCWSSADGSERHVEALGPVVEWNASPTECNFYLRPLYNRRNDKGAKLVRTDWLYPFGSSTFRPDLKRWVFYPLFLHDEESFSEGRTQKRWQLLPLLLWRRGRGPTDFLLVPFGGVLHNVLGRDKVVAVLWPLFVYQRGREARTWSFLHPIFSVVRWDGGGGGFKFWPLFGYNRKPGKLKKLFALWPLFHYLCAETHQGPQTYCGILPFYTSIQGPGGSEWHAPWPFVSHRVDKNQRQEDWWFFWPLVGRRTGQEISGWTFRPVYATERRGARRYVSFLWPLGWYTSSPTARGAATSFRVVPLMFHEREETRKGRRGAWQVWPLVKYRHDDEGWSNLEFPSPFPYRYQEEWERNFGPFFRVFEYNRSKEGVRSWRLLWRLVRVDSGPEDRYVEVTPLFRMHRKRAASRETSWSILKGLVGYERNGGRRRWQFLYLLSWNLRNNAERRMTNAE